MAGMKQWHHNFEAKSIRQAKSIYSVHYSDHWGSFIRFATFYLFSLFPSNILLARSPKILKSNKIILNAKTFSMLRHSLDAILLVSLLAHLHVCLPECLTTSSQHDILLQIQPSCYVCVCLRACVYVSSPCYLIMPSSYMMEWDGKECQKRKSFIQCAQHWYAAATMKNCWKCTMLYGGIIIHIDEAIKVCCERKVFSCVQKS